MLSCPLMIFLRKQKYAIYYQADNAALDCDEKSPPPAYIFGEKRGSANLREFPSMNVRTLRRVRPAIYNTRDL